MGYVATGEKTGWPLYTPRYDGAFVAGVYAQEAQLAGNRQVIAAIPTWTTLTLGVGSETYSPSTPASRITGFRQTLFLRCGLVRTALTWTTADGKSTDLVYDVLADRASAHVAAVRLSMTPRWSGRATVTAVLDGATSQDRPHRRSRRTRWHHRLCHVQHRHDEDRRRRRFHAPAGPERRPEGEGQRHRRADAARPSPSPCATASRTSSSSTSGSTRH